MPADNNSQIHELIEDFNREITPDYLEKHANSMKKVEEWMQERIEVAFGITAAIKSKHYQGVDKEKLKPLYYKLSKAFHPDRCKHAFARVLKAQKQESVSQSVLNAVWVEITKERSVYEMSDESPFDWQVYHPLYFAIKKIELMSTVCEGVKTYVQKLLIMDESGTEFDISKAFYSTLNEFDSLMREYYSDWYAYEVYPKPIRYLIYSLAMLINAILIGVFIISKMIPVMLWVNLLLLRLLSVSTAARYMQYDARTACIKAIYLGYQSNLTKENIDEAYDNLTGKNLAAMKTLLTQVGVEFSNSSDEEIEKLFEFYYVFSFSCNQEAWEPLSNIIPDEIAQFNLIKNRFLSDPMPLLSFIDFMKTTSQLDTDLVHVIFDNMRQLESSSIDTQSAYFFITLSAYQRLCSVALAMKDMVNDERLSLFERIFRSLFFVTISPLFFSSCVYCEIETQFMILLVAIKQLSVALINTPLTLYSFFKNATWLNFNLAKEQHQDLESERNRFEVRRGSG